MSTPLLAGERAILVTRRHWSVLTPAVATAAIAAIAGVLLLHLVPDTVAGRSLADARTLGSLAIIALAALVVLVRVLQWRAAQYLLTDRRIVVSRGVLSRYAESIALDRVQNTAVHQSIGARMIRCGDVEIESAGRDGTEVLHRISDPNGFENALMEAIDAHRDGAGRLAPPSPV